MASKNQSFGKFARALRIKAGFGLREAAREMDVSATYLSRVENDVDTPSAILIIKMSRLYKCLVEEFNAAARRPSVSAEVRGRETQSREDLRVLYRMGVEQLVTREELEQIIRSVLEKRGLGEEEVARELARLRSDLPRICQAQGGLLDADIKPRRLSKRNIASIANEVLENSGLEFSTYAPPTPIERLVDNQDGITYQVAELPCKLGSPIVLGLTRWSELTERQIIINSALADNTDSTSEHRFNFTLAHELFHAIEHLPLVRKATGPNLMRLQTTVFVERDVSLRRRTAAQQAVDRWTQSQTAGVLVTNEDWREWQANTFASYLLMPEWSVVAEFHRRVRVEFVGVPEDSNVREEALQIAGETFFGDVICEKSLAELFGVSRQAMAIRLLSLDLVREVSG